MIPLYLKDISCILNVPYIGKNCKIHTISIDSRTIKKNQKCIFVTIQGKKNNSEIFIHEAIKNGAIAILNTRLLPIDMPQIIVRNTIEALRKIAKWLRNKINVKIVAITGSCGKTSVKEMVFKILNICEKTLATKKNFNNTLGVLLTLLELKKEHKFAVIEVGGSRFNEIQHSSYLIRPNLILINNIVESHLLGFRSLYGVSQAKGEIFSGMLNDSMILLNSDSHNWSLWKNKIKNQSVFWFGLKKCQKNFFHLIDIIQKNLITKIRLNTPTGTLNIKLNTIGNHNISNAIAASILSYLLGVNLCTIAFGLKNFFSFPGRLFPIFLNKNQILFDDSYNANIGSMIAAISVLRKMPGYRVIIIGDMLDLGVNNGIFFHKKLGTVLSQSNIHRVFSIGYMSQYSSYISKKGKHYYDIELLLQDIMQILNQYPITTILAKGSHDTQIYKIVQILIRNTKYASIFI
ncbi:UDP-N-acetylmuramoyl-tripeptide:D-alanyl-D-alanine ligase [Wigglesworthia glossinidia endosymbiont of Glossina morsitans morsitans (Yale colony)]|uniref:UDP-N-acetylmuramoyl-tripeptide--D-alanyl-D-alanine ligase n=1 Tax=Wigglesworthia glossinidia endosymbiont of Glossina morsitans morsitans (Yale colony) TaxID=1142511 RepID=H6Q5A6_WIGGL|nr:UDP-N-acetylmuramoyl-tripeptide--D-alanyl-D-alanine ligase [Wigglesworthia glossinidia]AFA41389.1 UDP-N-acetylmuramoyl-tripeptide:D-alanyl-D-alanine ligase [Wigglesworthia glossinidia endosymbiont of Glossina morsitans morsitans (Yale colony)]